MKRIAVIPNLLKDKDLTVTKRVIDLLLGFDAEVLVEEKISSLISMPLTCYRELPDDTELLVVIGGDGSLLDASVLAIAHDIPMIGINLGKVGFLSEVEPDCISMLGGIFDGSYIILEKMLLSAEKVGMGGTEVSERLALNDVVISHSNYLGISEFTVSGDGEEIRYRADGLVVSTPQGSTAYSLSAGGPIVSHEIDSILVTPVCTHSFFNRSVLFPPSATIDLKNTGEDILNISIDGRKFSSVAPGEACRIARSPKRVKFLSFKRNNMISSVFKKMKLMEM